MSSSQAPIASKLVQIRITLRLYSKKMHFFFGRWLLSKIDLNGSFRQQGPDDGHLVQKGNATL
jgi:hypothetical protein